MVVLHQPMKNSTQTFKFLLSNPSVITTSSQAKQLHAHIIKIKGGTASLPEFATIVISIYSNFNLLKDCLSLFESFRSTPPSKAWKSIIRCCASNGKFSESVTFFQKMRASGKSPDRNVFPSLLKTCTHLRDLRLGEAIHGCVVRVGLDIDLFTGNALMNMYAKLESLDAGNVFGGCSERKVMLRCNNDLNETETPLGSVDQRTDLIDSDGYGDGEKVVIGTLTQRRKAEACHADSVSKVFETMPIRDVVSWNTVIGGHVQNGVHEEALLTLREMGKANMKPDSYTLSSILPVFAQYVDVMKGKEVHCYAVRHGYDKDVFIGSGLIDMYANCTRLEDSLKVFVSSPQKDKVSWNSMIAACVQNGKFDDGLKLFREMLMAGVKPVAVSFSSILPACAHFTTLCLGKQLHGYVIRHGFDDNIFVASSLMDMYAKCGNLAIARWIFDKMEFQDTISWTSMIMAYASHGHAHEAVSFFKKMEKEGVKPNAGSFLTLFTACSHGGLVDEALDYFTLMTQKYAIYPNREHYAAVSDLLGRAGRLDEAYDFISKMHIEPTVAIWSTVLSACRVHKNVEIAEKVAKKMFAMDPHCASAYILLSNVYVAAGRWKEAMKLRAAMRNKGIKKDAACSWIEVRNKVHVFVSGDEKHPDYAKINEALRVLMAWIEFERFYSPGVEYGAALS